MAVDHGRPRNVIMQILGHNQLLLPILSNMEMIAWTGIPMSTVTNRSDDDDQPISQLYSRTTGVAAVASGRLPVIQYPSHGLDIINIQKQQQGTGTGRGVVSCGWVKWGALFCMLSMAHVVSQITRHICQGTIHEHDYVASGWVGQSMI